MMNGVVRFLAMAGLVVGCVSATQAVDIQTVPVGNPGNDNDTHGDGYGGVEYAYRIGTFEVTAGQYTEFLNAVADEDTYELYSTSMWAEDSGCKIQRTGSSPNFNYTVAPDRADRPVNFVTWGDAVRFANWLHNGQPAGSQDLSTTEDGSYYLDGAMEQAALMAVVREDDATWVIPSEDEWYKAAYHYNDGVTGNYWDYPTESGIPPTAEAPPGADMTNGSANYNSAIGSPYYTTEVGAYDAKPSDSPYGTFDQAGNLWEWNEAVILDWYRGLRGGSCYNSDVFNLQAAGRHFNPSSGESNDVGFRVANVSEEEAPVPAVSEWGMVVMTLVMLSAGTLIFIRRRAAVG